jgi:hypothetical protein
MDGKEGKRKQVMKMMTVALVPCGARGVLGGRGKKEEEEGEGNGRRREKGVKGDGGGEEECWRREEGDGGGWRGKERTELGGWPSSSSCTTVSSQLLSGVN